MSHITEKEILRKDTFAEYDDGIEEVNSAGAILCYYRDRYNLTMEQVCDGICSKAKLSRLERGIRCVDSLTGSQLLERIGKETNLFELLLNDQDYVLWRARESIRQHMKHREYGRVREELAVYRAMKNNAPRLHEQFCGYQEVMMATDSRCSQQDEQLRLCENALQTLHLTKPTFLPDRNAGRQLYTTTEIGLILSVIHYGKNYGDIWAEELLLDLFHHVDHYYTEHRKQRTGYRILMELIELEQRLQDPDKELSYIDQGINFIVQGREIGGLNRLHFLRAQALMRRYGSEALGREIQRECLMAYSICEVFGDMQQMEVIRRFCEEKLKWQITGQAM